MLIKNEIYEARIEDYTAEGQGVAKIEGCAVFIPNAIAGELCRIRITLVRKTWAAGKIVEILEKSPHRVNRECPVAKLCGGCDFWHMDYEEESRLKADRVRNNLNRMGGEALEDLPILSAPTCYGYRNKAQYPVAAKVMGIISMACGIAALFFSFICFMVSIEALDGFGSLATPVITWIVMFTGAAIAGLVLSSKATEGGYDSVMPRLGKIFSIIALPSFGLDFILILVYNIIVKYYFGEIL